MIIKINPPVSGEDKKEQELFIQAVRAAKRQAKIMGCAIAGYDARKKKAYIDYPNKERVYID